MSEHSQRARAQATQEPPASRGRQRVRRVAAAGVASAVLLGVCSAAVADDPDARKRQVDGQITASQQDLDLVSADLKTALSTLSATNAKVARAQTTLTKAEGELRAANRYNTDIAGKLKVAQANETKNTAALKRTTDAQGRTKVLVGGLARQAYMQGGIGDLELTLTVLTSGDQEVTDKLSFADIVLRQQTGVLHTLSGQQASAKATGNRLGAIRTQVADLKRKASAGVIRARNARNTAATAKTSLESLRKTQTKAANDLKAKKDQELRDLTWLRGESTRLQKVLDARAKARVRALALARARAAKAKVAPPPASRAVPADGHFLQGPRPKSQITSPFGYRLHPILGIRMLHAGADFSFGCGTPVYAAADGEIVEAGTDSIAGNNIVIDHGRVGTVDLATRYQHLSAFVVRSGSVKKGQLIGRAGATGRATGCHLHFSVLVNGRYVDPADWIG